MKEINETGTKLNFVDDLNDQNPMKGILKYKVFRNGTLIEEVEDDNLIVNGAREQMAKLIAGEFNGRNITKVAFGENETSPDMDDTTIKNAFQKNISSYSFPELGQVQFNFELERHEANGKAIVEFGLITEDGTLFSRRLRKYGKPLNKEEDMSFIGQWIIIF